MHFAYVSLKNKKDGMSTAVSQKNQTLVYEEMVVFYADGKCCSKLHQAAGELEILIEEQVQRIAISQQEEKLQQIVGEIVFLISFAFVS